MLHNHQDLGTCDNRIGNVMSNFTRVEGHQDLVRDNVSGAIINRNRSAYEIAKKRAADAQRQRDEIRSATREINTLKCEMHEIKDMLKTLLDRNHWQLQHHR